jgi:prolyl-tRNA synthetase
VAKAFDVTFQAASGEVEHVWATSWGMSTRLIGATIMTHSDDAGLVLPPRVAPIQVVIVPIWRGDDRRQDVLDFAEKARKALSGRMRVRIDDRENMKPGAKYFEWERKGVPLRLEVGPRDVDGGSVFCAKRTGGKKFGISVGDFGEEFVDAIGAELDGIQAELLARATALRESRTFRVDSYDQMKSMLGEKAGFFLVPWCDDVEAEAAIKADCKATVRCYPLENRGEAEGKTCFYSGKPATHMAIFARAY